MIEVQDASNIENGGINRVNTMQDDEVNGNMEDTSNNNNLKELFMEYKEVGIMSQFVKGTILSGPAYNGYDANMDFKIKT
jgi:hypothetical protein